MRRAAEHPFSNVGFKKIKNINVSEGICVTKGGTASYWKKLKSLYILTKKCHDRYKNLDY